LLAALLRAKKIPARIASGLVYVETADGPMMGYHMWNEAYIGERWIPLDAVLGQGGIGAGHLKILESSLPDQNPYVALLPVLQVLGELKISSVTEQPVK
jgi:transglutaminase-like putative cysteine protease